MTSVAETGTNNFDENAKFAKELEEYRKARQMKYQQQKREPIAEHEEENKEEERNEVEDKAHNYDASENKEEQEMNTNNTLRDSSSSVLSSSAPSDCNNVTSPSLGREGDGFKLSSSVENLKLSGGTGRRGSLGKVMSFCSGIFKKNGSPMMTSTSSPSMGRTGSPSMGRDKEKAKLERKRAEQKAEQDWRMARLIAELEFSGKSDEEIQMHLFHIRDQSQFARPRSNSIGEWFKDINQAFKDEFSARRDGVTLNASTINPFAAAAPANYAHDTGYSYEDLVALESVPRGLKSLDHLPTTVFEGQQLPSNQITCAICMADFETGEDLRSLYCSHFYHKECIDKWLGVATACPVCKGEVDGDHTHTTPTTATFTATTATITTTTEC